MKRSLPTLAVLASLALGFGLAPTGGASAMSAPAAARTAVTGEAVPSNVEQVQYRERGQRYHRDRRQYDRRHWDRRHDRRWDRRHYRPHSGGIYFHFGTPAPRYAPPPRRYHAGSLSRAHVNWCHSRYRSYRAWDNTFQPYRGPRRQCVSPYV